MESLGSDSVHLAREQAVEPLRGETSLTISYATEIGILLGFLFFTSSEKTEQRF